MFQTLLFFTQWVGFLSKIMLFRIIDVFRFFNSLLSFIYAKTQTQFQYYPDFSWCWVIKKKLIQADVNQ